ncbi:MAG: phosphatidate cytidylyltransferase [Bacteroidales bacterium]|nr:phosphatidate cytidylyltransferase [Bacteroidales bacterium]
MNNLISRTLSGIVYIGLFIGTILWHPSAYALVALAINAMAWFEGRRLLKFNNSNKPLQIIISAASFLLFVVWASNYLQYIQLDAIAISLVVLLVVFIIKIFIDKAFAIENEARTLLLFIYISLPLLLSVKLNLETFSNDYRIPLLLCILIFIWTNDTGAYVFGSLFGKHKFFVRISPKKSWEGVIGGFLSTILAAWIISIFNLKFDFAGWVVIALLVVTFSVLGDLFESQLKRSANIKDSGSVIPGHGGILDRIDSFLFVVPVVYLYLSVFDLL